MDTSGIGRDHWLSQAIDPERVEGYAKDIQQVFNQLCHKQKLDPNIIGEITSNHARGLFTALHCVYDISSGSVHSQISWFLGHVAAHTYLTDLHRKDTALVFNTCLNAIRNPADNLKFSPVSFRDISEEDPLYRVLLVAAQATAIVVRHRILGCDLPQGITLKDKNN